MLSGALPLETGATLSHSQVWPPPAQSQQLRALVLESDRPVPPARPPSSTVTSGSPLMGVTLTPSEPCNHDQNVCPAPVGAQLRKLHQCKRQWITTQTLPRGAGIHCCSPSWPLASCISLGTDLAEGRLLANIITRESLHPMTGQCLDVKDWPPGLSSGCVCRASWFGTPCAR